MSISNSDFESRPAKRTPVHLVSGSIDEHPITAADFSSGGDSFFLWGLLPFGALLVVSLFQAAYFKFLPYGDVSYWIFILLITLAYGSLAFLAFRTVGAFELWNDTGQQRWALVVVMAILVVVLQAYATNLQNIFQYGDGGFGWNFEFRGPRFPWFFGSVIPAAAYIILREFAIRGIVIGELERQGHGWVRIVATATAFDFIASLTALSGLFIYGGAQIVVATIIVGTLIGLCMSVLRVGVGKLVPCIVVALVALIISTFVGIY